MRSMSKYNEYGGNNRVESLSIRLERVIEFIATLLLVAITGPFAVPFHRSHQDQNLKSGKHINMKELCEKVKNGHSHRCVAKRD